MTTAGWYPDPAGTPEMLRYWDGGAWTDRIQPKAPPTSTPEPAHLEPTDAVPGPVGPSASEDWGITVEPTVSPYAVTKPTAPSPDPELRAEWELGPTVDTSAPDPGELAAIPSAPSRHRPALIALTVLTVAVVAVAGLVAVTRHPGTTQAGGVPACALLTAGQIEAANRHHPDGEDPQVTAGRSLHAELSKELAKASARDREQAAKVWGGAIPTDGCSFKATTKHGSSELSVYTGTGHADGILAAVRRDRPALAIPDAKDSAKLTRIATQEAAVTLDQGDGAVYAANLFAPYAAVRVGDRWAVLVVTASNFLSEIGAEEDASIQDSIASALSGDSSTPASSSLTAKTYAGLLQTDELLGHIAHRMGY